MQYLTFLLKCEAAGAISFVIAAAAIGAATQTMGSAYESLRDDPITGVQTLLAGTIMCGNFWIGVAAIRESFRVNRRRRKGCCPRCGYDLRAAPEEGCPECGWRRS